jgi:hypothetical protein
MSATRAPLPHHVAEWRGRPRRVRLGGECKKPCRVNEGAGAGAVVISHDRGSTGTRAHCDNAVSARGWKGGAREHGGLRSANRSRGRMLRGATPDGTPRFQDGTVRRPSAGMEITCRCCNEEWDESWVQSAFTQGERTLLLEGRGFQSASLREPERYRKQRKPSSTDGVSRDRRSASTVPLTWNGQTSSSGVAACPAGCATGRAPRRSSGAPARAPPAPRARGCRRRGRRSLL